MEWALKLAMSVTVVVVLVGCARWLRLGPAPQLDDHATADAIARLDRFSPLAIALASDGSGALMRDAAGRWLLIRRHGVHWVTRVLDAASVSPARSDAASGHRVTLPGGDVLTFAPPVSGPFETRLEARPEDASSASLGASTRMATSSHAQPVAHR